MFEGRITVNGTNIHARVEGREGGPWVVLSNSLATNLSLWDEQIAAFAPKYQILRYDTRGHGRSDAAAGPYPMDVLVDDVRGLLNHFGAKRATLAGVSLGGLIALAAAERKVPEVGAIAVCDSRADFPPEFAKGMDDRNDLVRAKGMEAIVQPLIERWLTKESFARRTALKDKIAAMIRSTNPEGMIACTHAIRTGNLMPGLPSIAIPALFVIGDQDAALPVSMMKAMSEQVKGGAFAEIKGAGHLSNLEQPAAFNAALLGFLERVA